MQELRQRTRQTVRVGVLFHRRTKVTSPLVPYYGVVLADCICRYLIKSNDIVVDIVDRLWSDIITCMGCYSLTLTVGDTNQLGSLILYIFNGVDLEEPVFMEFNVIAQNVYDAKYGSALLKVEPEAQKF